MGMSIHTIFFNENGGGRDEKSNLDSPPVNQNYLRASTYDLRQDSLVQISIKPDTLDITDLDRVVSKFKSAGCRELSLLYKSLNFPLYFSF